MAAENRLKNPRQKVQHTRFYLSYTHTESVLSNKKLGLCGGGGALFIWRAP